MSVNAGAATVLERVRVHGGGADPLAARMRLEHRLAGADLRPPGMPAAAVLCVRELADPLPGGLGVDGPGTAGSRAWEDACRARLARILRSASHPAHELVPAAAEAVLFSDQSELLACLARDAVAGVAWSHWWWRRQRARAGPGRDPAVQAWLGAPAHAPAALALLAARGDAVPFVGWLTETQAALLTGQIAAAFGASSLQSVAARCSTAVVPAAAVTSGSRGPRDPRGPTGEPARVPPPWRELVPETRIGAVTALAPERELLLGVALALRSAPSRARSGPFADGVAAWLEAGLNRGQQRPGWGGAGGDSPDPTVVVSRSHAGESALDPSGGTAPEPAGAVAPKPPAVVRRPVPPASTSPSWVDGRAPGGSPVGPVPAPGAPEPSIRAPRGARSPGGTREPGVEPQAEGRVVSREIGATRSVGLHRSPAAAATASGGPASGDGAGLPAGAGATPPPGAGATPDPRPRAARAPALATAPDWFGATAVTETALGGVFYLLNLLIAVGLYGDFTTPREPGIELDPWDCVTLLARRLIGRPVPRDPVWPLLARLAGRTPWGTAGADRRVTAGCGFSPPRSWRAPAEWLEPFPAGGLWRWSAAGGTLRIVHPAGFAAIAVPRTGVTPTEQLTREWGRLPTPGVAPNWGDRSTPARTRLRRAALAPEPRAPLDRWVSRLAAYAEARLRLALGAGAQPPLAEVLFAHRARVVVTPTSVEITLRLAGLPLAVRFAGLDRTPGWLPAAGRFVSIEFE